MRNVRRLISNPLIFRAIFTVALLGIAQEAHTTIAFVESNSFEDLVQAADLIVIAKPLSDKLKAELFGHTERPEPSKIFQEFKIVEYLGSITESSNFHLPKIGSRIKVFPHHLTNHLEIKDLKTQEIREYSKGPAWVSFKLPNYIPPKDFGSGEVILFLTFPYSSKSKEKYDLAARGAVFEKSLENTVRAAIKLFPEKFAGLKESADSKPPIQK